MPPTAYQQFLMETAPRVIETEDQCEEIANRAGELVSMGRKRTPGGNPVHAAAGFADSGL
jgi:hypothetical protein